LSIRTKIILVVLPLLITGLLITGIFSSFSARSGMTRIATESLGFKADQLRAYATSQWNLLVSNDLTERPEYVEITEKAIAAYAEGLIRSESEIILAIDQELQVVFSTIPVSIGTNETVILRGLVANSVDGWIEAKFGGKDRVGSAFSFAPRGWLVLVTEDTGEFYREVTDIQTQSVYILSASLLLSLVLLLAFTGYLTRPLRRVVAAMGDIIQNNDLSRRVRIEYRDEIGELAKTFNIRYLSSTERMVRLKTSHSRQSLHKKTNTKSGIFSKNTYRKT
jgi:methyl-accepting chemotaxis protein